MTLFNWVLKKLYPFESCPVFGDLRVFRGIFRPNHNELAIVYHSLRLFENYDFRFLNHSISLSIEEVISIWILPSFLRPMRLSRRFPVKLQRVSHLARYHSLRLFEKYDFHFWITRFRWVLTKLWAFKVCPTFRPKSGLPFRLAPASSNHTKTFGPCTNKHCIWKEKNQNPETMT